MCVIPKIFGARQLFLRRNGAQMIPTKVSPYVGVENFDSLGAILILFYAKEVLLYWRIHHKDLRQISSFHVDIEDVLDIFIRYSSFLVGYITAKFKKLEKLRIQKRSGR